MRHPFQINFDSNVKTPVIKFEILQASQHHLVAVRGIAAKHSSTDCIEWAGPGTLLRMLSGLHDQEVNPEAKV